MASDAELVLVAQTGSEAAFAQLHDRYQHKIQKFCQALMKGDEGNDIAQEAFIRAWRSIDSCKGDRHFYPWLKTIARNLAYDAMRRNHPSVAVHDIEPRSLSSTWSSIQESEVSSLVRDRTELLRRAMSNIAPRHRSLLEQQLAGSTYAEIAHSFEISESTVKSVLWRARGALLREMDSYDAQARREQMQSRHLTGVRLRPSELTTNQPIRLDTTRLWEIEGRGWAMARHLVLATRHARRETPSLIMNIRANDLAGLAPAFGMNVTETVEHLKEKRVLVALPGR